MIDQEFLATVREKYGSRGVRDAKDFLKELGDESKFPSEHHDTFRGYFMIAWLTNKESARQKFTPKKYRRN